MVVSLMHKLTDKACACELKRIMINYELYYERFHLWRPGTDLVIQLADTFVFCLACYWMCHLKGKEAAEHTCNTWGCRGLLVYFIPDCWCRHNHSLEQPLQLYGFYVKGSTTHVLTKCNFVYRLCTVKIISMAIVERIKTHWK